MRSPSPLTKRLPWTMRASLVLFVLGAVLALLSATRRAPTALAVAMSVTNDARVTGAPPAPADERAEPVVHASTAAVLEGRRGDAGRPAPLAAPRDPAAALAMSAPHVSEPSGRPTVTDSLSRHRARLMVFLN